MKTRDNYKTQAAYARQLFLRRDSAELARKINTSADEEWLYVQMLSEDYRISRIDGHIQRKRNAQWIPADSFEETLTLFDLVCDSKMDRHPAYKWKDMKDFGHMFHQNLLESTVDIWALRFQNDPDSMILVCNALGGSRYPKGDIAFAIPFFESMNILVQFWSGDDEFPPRLRWLWDANADMYIRYETMYYAVGLIKSRMKEIIDNKS